MAPDRKAKRAAARARQEAKRQERKAHFDDAFRRFQDARKKARDEQSSRPGRERPVTVSQHLDDIKSKVNDAVNFVSGKSTKELYDIAEAEMAGATKRAQQWVADADRKAARVFSPNAMSKEDKTFVREIIGRLELGAEMKANGEVEGIAATIVQPNEMLMLEQILYGSADRESLVDFAQRIRPGFMQSKDMVAIDDPMLQLDRLRNFLLAYADPDRARAREVAAARQKIADAKIGIRADQAAGKVFKADFIDSAGSVFSQYGVGDAKAAFQQRVGQLYIGRGNRLMSVPELNMRWDPFRVDTIDELVADAQRMEAGELPQIFRPMYWTEQQLENLRAHTGGFGRGLDPGELLSMYPVISGPGGARRGSIGFGRTMTSADRRELLLNMPDHLISLDYETNVGKLIGDSVVGKMLSAADRSKAYREADQMVGLKMQTVMRGMTDISKEDPAYFDELARRMGAAFSTRQFDEYFASVSQAGTVEATRRSMVGMDQAQRMAARDRRTKSFQPDLSEFVPVGRGTELDQITPASFIEHLEGIEKALQEDKQARIAGLNTMFDIRTARRDAYVMGSRLMHEASQMDDQIEAGKLEALARRYFALSGGIESIDVKDVEGTGSVIKFSGGAMEQWAAKEFDVTVLARNFISVTDDRLLDKEEAKRFGKEVGATTRSWRIGDVDVLAEELTSDEFLADFSDAKLKVMRDEAEKIGRGNKVESFRKLFDMVEAETDEDFLAESLTGLADEPGGLSFRTIAEAREALEAAGSEEEAQKIAAQVETSFGRAIASQVRRTIGEGAGYSADELLPVMWKYARNELEGSKLLIGAHSALRDALFTLKAANMTMKSMLSGDKIVGYVKEAPWSDTQAGMRMVKAAESLVGYTRSVGRRLSIATFGTRAKDKGATGARGALGFLIQEGQEVGENFKDAFTEWMDDIGMGSTTAKRWAGQATKMERDVVTATAKLLGKDMDRLNVVRGARIARWGALTLVAGVIAFKVGTERAKQKNYDESWDYDKNERWTMADEQLRNQQMQRATMGNLTLQSHARRNNHSKYGAAAYRNRHLRNQGDR